MLDEKSRALQDRLEEYVLAITDRSPKAGRDMYVCPFCGSGTGESETGAFSIDRKCEDGVLRWKCFACNESGDIFDLAAKLNGLDPKPSLQVKNAILRALGEPEIQPGEYQKPDDVIVNDEPPQLSEDVPIQTGPEVGEYVRNQPERKESFLRVYGPDRLRMYTDNHPRGYWREPLSEIEAEMDLRDYNHYFHTVRGRDGRVLYVTGKRLLEGGKTDYDFDLTRECLQYYFRAAHYMIDVTDYHRGLSKETLDRFNVGFDPDWKHPVHEGDPKAHYKDAPRSPRLIIPTGPDTYLARDTRPASALFGDSKNHVKKKVNGSPVFNLEALRTAEQPIWIVEGEIDALSIIDVGGEAIGLGSKNNADKFLRYVSNHWSKSQQPFIIAMDNDKAGREAALKLRVGLAQMDAPFISMGADVFGEYKDANELLMADRGALRWIVSSARRQTEDRSELEKAIEEGKKASEELENLYREKRISEYNKNAQATVYLNEFIDMIGENANTPCVSTGFTNLDRALDGGLYEGLYIVGALSSLGKTTLVMQIADQIATQGHDVLIFSLEMARSELLSKTISRLTLQLNLEDGGSDQCPKTSRGITDGRRWGGYSDEEIDLINRAVNEYETFSDHIYIREGLGDIRVQYPEDDPKAGQHKTKSIWESVNEHVMVTGRTPVVIVDYLQILAPYNDRLSDKQNTDKSVLELKRLSREYKTPVIAVSSFNRENYNKAVSMTAFKESGERQSRHAVQ